GIQEDLQPQARHLPLDRHQPVIHGKSVLCARIPQVVHPVQLAEHVVTELGIISQECANLDNILPRDHDGYHVAELADPEPDMRKLGLQRLKCGMINLSCHAGVRCKTGDCCG